MVVVRHPWFRGESVAKRVVGMSGDLVLRGEPPGQEGEGDGRDMGAMMVEVCRFFVSRLVLMEGFGLELTFLGS